MLGLIKKIVGFDIHVAFTLAFRGWAIVAGAVTTVAIPSFLSPIEQGFYYAFASVLALQIFFELGLNQVIIQLVSHDIAHVDLNAAENSEKSADRIGRLYDLRNKLNSWYRLAAILFVVAVGFGGWQFFNLSGRSGMSGLWVGVWLSLVVLTALNLYLSPSLAFAEGAGRVAEISRVRLVQSLCGYLLFWVLLALGLGLWGSLAVPGVAVLISWIWVRRDRKNWEVVNKITPSHKFQPIKWKRDIFPLQWRIGVSWICGYFVFNLFTPVVFATHGAEAAGRLGLAIAIFNAAGSLGLSWIGSKLPHLSMHISRQEWTEADSLHKATLIRAAVLTAAVVVFLTISVWALDWSGSPWAKRVADPQTAAWLALAALFNVLIFGMAAYMRAHREEPMVPVSLTSAIITVAMVSAATSWPISRLMASYAAIAMLVTAPWTYMLLQKYKARHSSLCDGTGL